MLVFMNVPSETTHQLICTWCLFNHLPPNKLCDLGSTIWTVLCWPWGVCEDVGLIDYSTLEMIRVTSSSAGRQTKASWGKRCCLGHSTKEFITYLKTQDTKTNMQSRKQVSGEITCMNANVLNHIWSDPFPEPTVSYGFSFWFLLCHIFLFT